MMRRIIFVFAFLGVFSLGCSTTRLAVPDLFRATELKLSAGTPQQRVIKGQDLKRYLGTFAETPRMGVMMVHNSQRGTIKIDGDTYPVHYCEEKVASRPAVITVKNGADVLSIKQRR